MFYVFFFLPVFAVICCFLPEITRNSGLLPISFFVVKDEEKLLLPKQNSEDEKELSISVLFPFWGGAGGGKN